MPEDNQNQPFITPSDALQEEKTNQPQSNRLDDQLDDEMTQVKTQLRQVSLSETGWKKDLHQKINELRMLADSPQVLTREGAALLELGMTNLGMPGIDFSGKALEQLDLREEAMFEERSLQKQDKSYQALGENEKQVAEARVYNGNQIRGDWRRLYDFNRYNDLKFNSKQSAPAGQSALKALQTIIENEIRLAAARNPELELDFNDNKKVREIAARITNDIEFIKILNQEKSISPNTTNIKFEILKRIKSDNETYRNLQSGN